MAAHVCVCVYHVLIYFLTATTSFIKLYFEHVGKGNAETLEPLIKDTLIKVNLEDNNYGLTPLSLTRNVQPF